MSPKQVGWAQEQTFMRFCRFLPLALRFGRDHAFGQGSNARFQDERYDLSRKIATGNGDGRMRTETFGSIPMYAYCRK